MSGVTDEEIGLVNVTVKLPRETLDRLERLVRSGHRGPGDPTPEAMVRWALSAYVEVREREK